MTRYSIEPRDSIFVKGCEFLTFAKNMSKKISKNSQTLFDHAKQCVTDSLKTYSKRLIQKTAEVTGDLNSKSTWE